MTWGSDETYSDPSSWYQQQAEEVVPQPPPAPSPAVSWDGPPEDTSPAPVYGPPAPSFAFNSPPSSYGDAGDTDASGYTPPPPPLPSYAPPPTTSYARYVPPTPAYSPPEDNQPPYTPPSYDVQADYSPQNYGDVDSGQSYTPPPEQHPQSYLDLPDLSNAAAPYNPNFSDYNPDVPNPGTPGNGFDTPRGYVSGDEYNPQPDNPTAFNIGSAIYGGLSNAGQGVWNLINAAAENIGSAQAYGRQGRSETPDWMTALTSPSNLANPTVPMVGGIDPLGFGTYARGLPGFLGDVAGDALGADGNPIDRFRSGWEQATQHARDLTGQQTPYYDYEFPIQQGATQIGLDLLAGQGRSTLAGAIKGAYGALQLAQEGGDVAEIAAASANLNRLLGANSALSAGQAFVNPTFGAVGGIFGPGAGQAASALDPFTGGVAAGEMGAQALNQDRTQQPWVDPMSALLGAVAAGTPLGRRVLHSGPVAGAMTGAIPGGIAASSDPNLSPEERAKRLAIGMGLGGAAGVAGRGLINFGATPLRSTRVQLGDATAPDLVGQAGVRGVQDAYNQADAAGQLRAGVAGDPELAAIYGLPEGAREAALQQLVQARAQGKTLADYRNEPTGMFEPGDTENLPTPEATRQGYDQNRPQTQETPEASPESEATAAATAPAPAPAPASSPYDEYLARQQALRAASGIDPDEAAFIQAAQAQGEPLDFGGTQRTPPPENAPVAAPEAQPAAPVVQMHNQPASRFDPSVGLGEPDLTAPPPHALDEGYPAGEPPPAPAWRDAMQPKEPEQLVREADFVAQQTGPVLLEPRAPRGLGAESQAAYRQLASRLNDPEAIGPAAGYSDNLRYWRDQYQRAQTPQQQAAAMQGVQRALHNLDLEGFRVQGTKALEGGQTTLPTSAPAAVPLPEFSGGTSRSQGAARAMQGIQELMASPEYQSGNTDSARQWVDRQMNRLLTDSAERGKNRVARPTPQNRNFEEAYQQLRADNPGSDLNETINTGNFAAHLAPADYPWIKSPRMTQQFQSYASQRAFGGDYEPKLTASEQAEANVYAQFAQHLDQIKQSRGTAPASQPLPPMADNYLKPLSEYTNALYREESPDQVERFLKTGRSLSGNQMGEVYAANTPNLARKPGAPTGIMLEFDPAGVQGQVNTSKPAWQVAYQNGEAEFVSRHNTAADWQNALRSVTIAPDAKVSAPYKARLQRALSTWDQTTNADGSVTYRSPSRPTGNLDEAAGGGGGGGLGAFHPATQATSDLTDFASQAWRKLTGLGHPVEVDTAGRHPGLVAPVSDRAAQILKLTEPEWQQQLQSAQQARTQAETLRQAAISARLPGIDATSPAGRVLRALDEAPTNRQLVEQQLGAKQTRAAIKAVRGYQATADVLQERPERLAIGRTVDAIRDNLRAGVNTRHPLNGLERAASALRNVGGFKQAMDAVETVDALMRSGMLLSARFHGQNSHDAALKNVAEGYSPFMTNQATQQFLHDFEMNRLPAAISGSLSNEIPAGAMARAGKIPVLGGLVRGADQLNRSAQEGLEKGFRSAVFAGEKTNQARAALNAPDGLKAQLTRAARADGMAPARLQGLLAAVDQTGGVMGGRKLRAILDQHGLSPQAATSVGQHWANALDAADQAAVKRANDLHYDYSDQRNADAILNAIQPFHVWATRNVPYYIGFLGRHPEVAAQTSQYDQAADEERKRRGLPKRFAGKLPIPSWLDPAGSALRKGYQTFAELSPLNALRGQIYDTAPMPQNAPNLGQLTGKTDLPFNLSNLNPGELLAQGRMVGAGVNPLITALPYWKGALGEQEPYPIFPLERLLNGITGSGAFRPTYEISKDLYSLGTGTRKEGEQVGPVRGALGALFPNDPRFQSKPYQAGAPFQTGDPYTDDLVRKKAAELYAAQTGRAIQSDPEAMRALNDPNSPAFQRALAEVRQETGYQKTGQFLIPFPNQPLSPEESQLRQDALEEKARVAAGGKPDYTGTGHAYTNVGDSPELWAFHAAQQQFFALPKDQQRAFLNSPDGATVKRWLDMGTPQDDTFARVMGWSPSFFDRTNVETGQPTKPLAGTAPAGAQTANQAIPGAGGTPATPAAATGATGGGSAPPMDEQDFQTALGKLREQQQKLVNTYAGKGVNFPEEFDPNAEPPSDPLQRREWLARQNFLVGAGYEAASLQGVRSNQAKIAEAFKARGMPLLEGMQIGANLPEDPAERRAWLEGQNKLIGQAWDFYNAHKGDPQYKYQSGTGTGGNRTSTTRSTYTPRSSGYRTSSSSSSSSGRYSGGGYSRSASGSGYRAPGTQVAELHTPGGLTLSGAGVRQNDIDTAAQKADSVNQQRKVYGLPPVPSIEEFAQHEGITDPKALLDRYHIALNAGVDEVKAQPQLLKLQQGFAEHNAAREKAGLPPLPNLDQLAQAQGITDPQARIALAANALRDSAAELKSAGVTGAGAGAASGASTSRGRNPAWDQVSALNAGLADQRAADALAKAQQRQADYDQSKQTAAQRQAEGQQRQAGLKAQYDQAAKIGQGLAQRKADDTLNRAWDQKLERAMGKQMQQIAFGEKQQDAYDRRNSPAQQFADRLALGNRNAPRGGGGSLTNNAVTAIIGAVAQSQGPEAALALMQQLGLGAAPSQQAQRVEVSPLALGNQRGSVTERQPYLPPAPRTTLPRSVRTPRTGFRPASSGHARAGYRAGYTNPGYRV